MSGFFLTVDAEEDTQDIYLFTEATWGEQKGRDYVLSLYDTFDLLGTTPLLGRLRHELGDGIRSHSHASHVIFYMEWQGETAILRVLHNSRDFEELFDIYPPVLIVKND